MVKASWIKPGAIVIDVGINTVPGEGSQAQSLAPISFQTDMSYLKKPAGCFYINHPTEGCSGQSKLNAAVNLARVSSCTASSESADTAIS